MSAQVTYQPTTTSLMVESIVRQIFSMRRITKTDQRQLMTILLSKDELSLDDQTQINRVFDALRQGLIRVVD